VMAERAPASLPDGIAMVRAGNVRRALALAAARLYPRQPGVIAAVTGTSGKPRLDDAACTMVKKRWKFKPATQDGKAVAVSVPAEVIFALK